MYSVIDTLLGDDEPETAAEMRENRNFDICHLKFVNGFTVKQICQKMAITKHVAWSAIRKDSRYIKSGSVYNWGDFVGGERIYGIYKRRAEKKVLPFDLSRSVFHKMAMNLCSVCGAEPSNCQLMKNDQYTSLYNGIDRDNSELGYVVGNVFTYCGTCNRLKFTGSKKDAINHAKKIVKYQKHIGDLKGWDFV